MKPYVSWSEFSLWKKDPNEYFARYVMGLELPATPEMRFGSIMGEALAGEIPGPTKKLKAEFFTSDFIRVGEGIYKQIGLPKAPEVAEYRCYVTGTRENGLKVDVLSFFDRYNPQLKWIREFKTTKNGWRTQEDVDAHGQLTMYALAHYFLLGLIPTMTLTRLDRGNGRVKDFTTVRTLEQIDELVGEINDMYDDLTARGWWAGRIARGDYNKKPV